MSSFCAFGFRSDSSTNLATWVASVRGCIEALNHEAIIDNLSVDLEVSPGLHSFCESQQIDRLLYINTEKRSKIGPNSQEVFAELALVDYADDVTFVLLPLLTQAALTYPGAELYLFFAFEWEAHTRSRLITCEKAGIADILHRYYSYFYTLFDSQSGNYVLDLDTPTIIRITSCTPTTTSCAS